MPAWPPSALVLTAGVGSRLEPLTRSRAKPAVPIAGVPLVARILRALGEAGVVDAVLNLHHRPETVTGIVGEGRQYGMRVRYTWEPAILGSAGGPRRALPLLGSDPFFIINGDTLPTVDLGALWAAHRTSGARVTMTLIPNPDPLRYGGVLLDDEGWVTGFTRRGDARPSYHFFYAQVADPGVFAGLDDGVPAASVGGVYDALIASAPRSVRGYVCDAPFVEVGTPADYVRVHLAFAASEARDPWAPGARCRIDPTAQVVRSILWDDVVVEANAVVEDCILTDGVHVPAGAILRHQAFVKEKMGSGGFSQNLQRPI